ncbi:MAG: glycoside hydrolase family 3 C-terminal domain-containing protein [Actinomycetota bacterium]
MTPDEYTLDNLTLEEKSTVTAGRDVWTVPGIEALGVPPLKMTDGPNGARGDAFTGGVRAVAVPCGSALAATFDPALVHRIGKMLGREARQKQCRVLLAPTINLIRSPLYGRSFECYGEDPWHSGQLAAAFISGVQSEGVATTPKHFIGNEAEFERYTIDSVIDERTLREVYLQPFEWAVRHANALGIMTSYNRLNGTYCSEDRDLLQGILRDEWGFEGFVVSDWFAAGETVASLEAGLDVQMPGPDRFYGGPVAKAIANGEADEAHLDAIVDRRIHVHRVLGAWDDDVDQAELGVEHDEDRALAREAAAASMVLLANDGVLPLDPTAQGAIALIGPNAATAHLMGGGSAQLAAHRRTTLAEELTERFGDRVRVEPGCNIDKVAPMVRPDAPFEIEFYASDDWSGDVIARSTRSSGRAIWSGEPAPGMGTDSFSARMVGHVTALEAGTHTFTLTQLYRSRLFINGEVVIDGHTVRPPRGDAFFGMGSIEMSYDIELDAGEAVELLVESVETGGTGIRGVAVGHRAPIPADLIQRAATLAAESETAIVVVGTSDEWETEGVDRASIDLPGDQDALVSAVCAANPRTVVVVNTGSPVTMPWVDEPAAIVASWLGGQEMAPALADVLYGIVDPGGRLAVTFPERIEHTPSFGNFPGESNRTLYGEGPLIGHRWYDTRHLPVLFPFGHGGSYTTFDWGAPRVAPTDMASATVELEVTNTGDRAGSDVVQLYVAPPSSPFTRPSMHLAGTAKVHLEAGERALARIELRPRSFAFWNPANTDHIDIAKTRGGAAAMAGAGEGPPPEPGWYVDQGDYTLLIARSSRDIHTKVEFVVESPVGPLIGEESLP